MTPAAFARDIAADLEEDALQVAVDFEGDPVLETDDGLGDELPEAA